jgi:hypothetical protein
MFGFILSWSTMVRKKKANTKDGSDDEAEDHKIGIFSHKVCRFKRKGASSDDDDASDGVSDDSDDDFRGGLRKRKKGR